MRLRLVVLQITLFLALCSVFIGPADSRKSKSQPGKWKKQKEVDKLVAEPSFKVGLVIYTTASKELGGKNLMCNETCE